MHEQRCLLRGYLRYVLSFTAQNFQPYITTQFLGSVLTDHFVFRRRFLLALETNLVYTAIGSHAHVNVFCKEKVSTYIWGSNTSRPYGQLAPSVCHTCGLPFPWTTSRTSGNTTVLKCKKCGIATSMTFQMPDDLQPLQARPCHKWYERRLVDNQK